MVEEEVKGKDVMSGSKEPDSRDAAPDGAEGKTLVTMPLPAGFEACQVGAALTAAEFRDRTDATEVLSYASRMLDVCEVERALSSATPEQLMEDLARTSMKVAFSLSHSLSRLVVSYLSTLISFTRDRQHSLLGKRSSATVIRPRLSGCRSASSDLKPRSQRQSMLKPKPRKTMLPCTQP